MSYQLAWHTPDKVLLLKLSGVYPVDEAREADTLILKELEQSDNKLVILIDAMNMTRPYNFTEIRAVQSFMNHAKLNEIYVGSSDRLVKLAMMIIFNLSRSHLYVFDNLDQANLMIQRRLTNF